MSNFELLERAGFKEFKSSQVPFPWWIKVGARTAFSFAAIEDSDFEWLSLRSRERQEGDEFIFYFAYGESINADLCDRILRQIGIEAGTPISQRILPKR